MSVNEFNQSFLARAVYVGQPLRSHIVEHNHSAFDNALQTRMYAATDAHTLETPSEINIGLLNKDDEAFSRAYNKTASRRPQFFGLNGVTRSVFRTPSSVETKLPLPIIPITICRSQLYFPQVTPHHY